MNANRTNDVVIFHEWLKEGFALFIDSGLFELTSILGLAGGIMWYITKPGVDVRTIAKVIKDSEPHDDEI